MSDVTVTINGTKVTVPSGSTILEAAQKLNINIPTLCYCKDVGCGVSNKPASCRICLVEATGVRGLAAACVQQVAEGMEVKTNTPALRKSRKTTLELMLSNHRMDCLTCSRNSHCELRQLASDLGIDAVRYVPDNLLPRIDTQSKSVVGLVAGAWHADGTVRARAVSRYQGDGFFTKPNFDSYRSDDASLNTAPPWQQLNNLGSLRYGSSHAYTVGVLSYGPDGKIDTDDDISTWPDEVE